MGKHVSLSKKDCFMVDNTELVNGLTVEIKTACGKTFRCSYEKLNKTLEIIHKSKMEVLQETFLENPNLEVDYSKEESKFKKFFRFKNYNGEENE
jgi:hypothetical protein